MRLFKRIVPHRIRTFPRNFRHHAIVWARQQAERWGLAVARASDYYSPLPGELELRRTNARWNKPSALRGIRYDLPAMQTRLAALAQKYVAEFNALPPFEELRTIGFGPGYTKVDAFTLYATLRELKPRQYLEVGSGLSTYYAQLARAKNRTEGADTQITCIEPFPYAKLREIDQVDVIASPVQDIPVERFAELAAGDVLFIDSSHAVKIDGDVPYLILEVLPALAPGVHVHIHDIAFPYNIPYPAEYWTLREHRRSPRWPIYWTEAMMVQAFLAHNQTFEIELSCPLLRHFDEPSLAAQLPFYQGVAADPNTFSSLWLRKIA
jgi:hypothetical protein